MLAYDTPISRIRGAMGAVDAVCGHRPGIDCRSLPQGFQHPKQVRGAHELTQDTPIRIGAAIAKQDERCGGVCKCMLAAYTVYVAERRCS